MTICFMVVILGNKLSAVGQVVMIVLWLALTALWITTATAQSTPTPTWPATPTWVPAPTLDLDRVRCTTFSLPGNVEMTCCALWNGNRWGQGTWQPMGCTK